MSEAMPAHTTAQEALTLPLHARQAGSSPLWRTRHAMAKHWRAKPHEFLNKNTGEMEVVRMDMAKA